MALRLIALYSWAKGTELLALYMLQGEPAGFVLCWTSILKPEWGLLQPAAMRKQKCCSMAPRNIASNGSRFAMVGAGL